MTSQEPIMAIVKLIRAQVTDPNTTRNSLPVFPDWPRKDLTKGSYPRVSVTRISETETPTSIGATNYMEDEIHLQIDVWIWAKKNDAQILTISSVTYSESKLRDYFARDIINKLRQNFYSDSNTAGYFDFVVTGVADLDFDEVDGIMRTAIDIEIKRMETS